MPAAKRKVRRKLPPVPQGDAPVFVPRSRSLSPSVQSNRMSPDIIRSRKSDSQSDRSDDSLNDDDMEVACINKTKGAPKRRPKDSVRNAMPPEEPQAMKIDRTGVIRKDTDSTPPVPPKISPASTLNLELNPSHRMVSPLHKMNYGVPKFPSEKIVDEILSAKDETDRIIDSLISIYDMPITTAMKSMKRRLQDELRRVTEKRRRKLEEMEEIRYLQAQIEKMQMVHELPRRFTEHMKPIPAPRSVKAAQLITTMQIFDAAKLMASSSGPSTPRSSPQVLPRRARHRRQTSDPMIVKFSPIKEDKDVESDMQARMTDEDDDRANKYATDDSSLSGHSDTDSTLSEPPNPRYKKIKPSAYAKMFYSSRTAQSADKLYYDYVPYPGPPLSGSYSDTYLAEGMSPGPKLQRRHHEREAKVSKEEKKQHLQWEIEKRKKQLEETTRLQTELMKLSRARQALAHSFDDIPISATYSTYAPPKVSVRTGVVKSFDGIIKPLDDDAFRLEQFPSEDSVIYKDNSSGRLSADSGSSHSNYSSTEYLAHKQEIARKHRIDEFSPYVNQYASMGAYVEPHASSSPAINTKVEYSVRVPASVGVDPGMSSSMTLPDIYSNRSDLHLIPSREGHIKCDSENSPVSDYTPAMPLLTDVKTRSRKILHEIGSRPVSAEFNFPGGVEGKISLFPFGDTLHLLWIISSA